MALLRSLLLPLVAALVAGCATTYATMPRLDQRLPAPAGAELPTTEVGVDHLGAALAGRTHLLFDAASVPADQSEYQAGPSRYRFVHGADGRWHFHDLEAAAIEVMAVEEQGEHLRALTVDGGMVCLAACARQSFVDGQCQGISAARAPEPPCFSLEAYLPGPPRRIAVEMGAVDVAVRWIPVSGAGQLDAARLGLELRIPRDVHSTDGLITRLKPVTEVSGGGGTHEGRDQSGGCH